MDLQYPENQRSDSCVEMHPQEFPSTRIQRKPMHKSLLPSSLPSSTTTTAGIQVGDTMASVTTQASATVFRPCASKSRFLTGSSGKLNRGLSFKPMAPSSSSSTSFKVEAKKGEWLPGLPSPAYLNGR